MWESECTASGARARTRRRAWRWITGSGVALFFVVAFAFLADAPAQAATGDGGLLWRRCTDNDCSRVENETAIYRRNGSAYLLSGFRGIGWKGTLRIRIAAAETHDGIPTVVDVNATLSWSWFSTSLGLSANAPSWQDAFGVLGLTLTDATITGSFNLMSSNAPNLTVAAAATLPQLWIYDFQVVVDHPVSFSAKLDKSKPVIEMHVGADDGDPSLRPLLRTSIPADNTIVAIDDASLVVAPNGGSAGGSTYEPGIWLGFAGAIGGHPVSLSAEYRDDERRLVGNGHLEQLGVGALTMSDWDFDFDLSPTFVDAEMSGSVEMAGGPTFDVAGQVFTTTTCDICVSFRGTASNVTLDAIDIETMEVRLDADLDASLLTASLDANLLLFDQAVQVGGNVTVQNGDLSRFDIAGSASPVCPKPGVCLTGPSPLGGPSFEGRYDSSAADVFDIDFDGTLTAEDLEISLQGHLDETGADFEGQLVLESIVNVSMSGHFFFGSNLAGEQIRDRDGNLVQAQSGDWRADATGSVNTTLADAQFRGDLLFDTGSVGSTEWVDAVGNVNVSNPARNTELDGSVSGSFSGLSGGMTDYTLHVVGSGRFRGLEASGTATVRPSTVTIAATTYVPDLGTWIGFSGNSTFNCTGGACAFTYHLTGSADFQLNGIRAHGEFTVDDTTGIWAVVDAAGTKPGMGFSAHFSAAIPDGGTICANASASAYMTNAPYVGTLNFAGNVSYCNRSINGTLYGALSYTQYTGYVFDVVGYVRAGVDAHGSLRMDVNNNGFVVTGSGQGSVFSQQNFEWVWNPPDPDNWCCRIDYAPVDLVIANNRIHAWVNVLFWDIDLVSEYVPYLSGTLEGWD